MTESDLFSTNSLAIATCGSIDILLPALPEAKILFELVFRAGASVTLQGDILYFSSRDHYSTFSASTPESTSLPIDEATVYNTSAVATTTSTVENDLALEPQLGNQDSTIVVVACIVSIIMASIFGIVTFCLVNRKIRVRKIRPVPKTVQVLISAETGSTTSVTNNSKFGSCPPLQSTLSSRQEDGLSPKARLRKLQRLKKIRRKNKKRQKKKKGKRNKVTESHCAGDSAPPVNPEASNEINHERDVTVTITTPTATSLTGVGKTLPTPTPSKSPLVRMRHMGRRSKVVIRAIKLLTAQQVEPIWVVSCVCDSNA